MKTLRTGAKHVDGIIRTLGAKGTARQLAKEATQTLASGVVTTEGEAAELEKLEHNRYHSLTTLIYP